MSEQLNSFEELLDKEQFINRHLGSNASDQQKMLETLGVASRQALIDQTVPSAIRIGQELKIEDAVTEIDALAELRSHAEQNQLFRNFIGMGYYGTQVPNVILRNVLENPAWYTAYTPYQPEISQGRLESLLNFQQLVMDLSGMDLANASLLDEATAAAEAMTLLKRSNRKKSDQFFISVLRW